VTPPREHTDRNTDRYNDDQGRQVATADLAEIGDRRPEVDDVQDERAQDRAPDDERGEGEKTGAQQAASSHALVLPGAHHPESISPVTIVATCGCLCDRPGPGVSKARVQLLTDTRRTSSGN
jgi:hypothetical protein